MSYLPVGKKKNVTALVVVIFIAALLSSACTNAGTTTTTNTNSSPSSTPAASSTTASAVALEAREPERYSVGTTITIQPTGNAPQTNIPPLQFVLAKMGTDRRVSFKLPDPVGEVVYLEKAPLKYLIFPARNQYVELDPNELGFQLGELMSPPSMIERLKARAQHEMLGTETVNGRTAIKYRFKATADTRTKAGTAQADSILYVDQETGLPLRAEVDATSESGAGARIVSVSENLTLNVEPSMFEVPLQMKKVTSTELKQQVQSFVSALRGLAAFMRQHVATPPPAG